MFSKNKINEKELEKKIEPPIERVTRSDFVSKAKGAGWKDSFIDLLIRPETINGKTFVFRGPIRIGERKFLVFRD